MYWIAPTYSQAAEGWELIKWLAPQCGGTIKEAERKALFPGGGSVQAKTADNPDSLRGAGLSFAVLDECRDMKPETWTHVVRPALADRKGRALFISTPNGRNWFWDVYRKAQDSEEWESFTFPTTECETVDAAEIEAARLELPEAVFRQEFLAEFIDGGGLVFRFLREAATGEPKDPGTARHFVFADLASTYDFNAVSVVRADGNMVRQVYVDRWNRLPVETTLQRIREVARRYRGEVCIDATSMGGDFAHQWLSDIRADGVKFTNANKTEMVHHLMALLEHRRIQIIDPDVSPEAAAQYGELMDYTATKLTTGYRYEAPSGKHDDTVTALMGSCYMAKESTEYAAPALLDAGII